MKPTETWESIDQTTNALKRICPDAKTTNETVEQVYNRYMKEWKFASKASQYGASSAGRKYIAILGGRKIVSLTAADLTEIVKKVTKLTSYGNALGIRSELIAALRYAVTGSPKAKDMKPPPPEGPKKSTLKMLRSKLETLRDMVYFSESGRFADLRMEVKKEIRETPQGEYACIKATPEMIESKKEREAARSAINSMLAKNKLPWTCQWSGVGSVLMVVRKSDWQAVKRGEK